MEEEFAKRHGITPVYRKLFKVLWRDNYIPNKYYVSIDYNFIKRFFAQTDADAIQKTF